MNPKINECKFNQICAVKGYYKQLCRSQETKIPDLECLKLFTIMYPDEKICIKPEWDWTRDYKEYYVVTQLNSKNIHIYNFWNNFIHNKLKELPDN